MFGGLKKGILGVLKCLKEREIKPEDLEGALDDLYIALLSNDVAVEVADRIVGRMRESLVGRRVPRFQSLDRLFFEELRNALGEILKLGVGGDLCELIRSSGDRPFSIVFFGVNGVGKTTTIAKIANYLMKRGFSVVLACSDTFRAAAIEQLEHHARALGIRMIRHSYGSDPAAVAYDAVNHARSRGIDVVLIDTAGRQHSNVNLMEELRKIVRVARPSYRVLVLDALTGNDAYNQARYFEEGVGVDGIVFTKIDADAKGGAVITVIEAIRKPVLFLGTGPGYDDLVPYDPEFLLERLLPGGGE